MCCILFTWLQAMGHNRQWIDGSIAILYINPNCSLPRWRIQEIKRTYTAFLAHGLFITYTQINVIRRYHIRVNMHGWIYLQCHPLDQSPFCTNAVPLCSQVGTGLVEGEHVLIVFTHLVYSIRIVFLSWTILALSLSLYSILSLNYSLQYFLLYCYFL